MPLRRPSRSRKTSAARASRAANVARLNHLALWLDYWRGKVISTRNALVLAHMPHAIGIARRVLRRSRCDAASPRDVTSDERAVIALALARVIERYDASKASFCTYMWYAVRGAVIDLWRKQGWLPKRWSQDVKMISIDQIRDDYASGFPGDVDVSAAADERLPAALVNRDGISAMEGAVETHDQCLKWLAVLSGLDEVVIRMRYLEDVSFKEIAAWLGVTRQRVSFVHRRALDRIREYEEGRS